MVFLWDKSIETGNTLIDEEHKKLIQGINDFLDVCHSEQAGENLQKTLRFVNDYTIQHFFDEEQLQLKYKYPNYDNHHAFHEGYKKVVKDLMITFITKGYSEELVATAKHDIGDVLIAHIKHEDVRLAAHIRAQEK